MTKQERKPELIQWFEPDLLRWKRVMRMISAMRPYFVSHQPAIQLFRQQHETKQANPNTWAGKQAQTELT